jgi:hypothetical protein
VAIEFNRRAENSNGETGLRDNGGRGISGAQYVWK